MSSSSSKKTGLITGCSAGGIGRALALEFYPQGFRVFATARDPDSMRALAACGDDMHTLRLDVTDADAIRAVRDEVALQTGGRLDVLVNNAYVLPSPDALTDVPLARVREIFEVNVFAPLALLQAFAPLLIAAAAGGDLHDVRVLHIGSICGIMPLPFSGAYNASKAALHAFGDTARAELAPFKLIIISNIERGGRLPTGSLYAGMGDLYQEKRVNASQRNAMPTDEYARVVVAEATRAAPRAWVWAGRNALLVWVMDTFLVRTAFDYLMNRTFGLDEFQEREGQA
ncbi:NAD-P-binding protein [Mycena epipterygia]|nr:NAD-P-binding protein [Mycena epipterygia]